MVGPSSRVKSQSPWSSSGSLQSKPTTPLLASPSISRAGPLSVEIEGRRERPVPRRTQFAATGSSSCKSSARRRGLSVSPWMIRQPARRAAGDRGGSDGPESLENAGSLGHALQEGDDVLHRELGILVLGTVPRLGQHDQLRARDASDEGIPVCGGDTRSLSPHRISMGTRLFVSCSRRPIASILNASAALKYR